MRTIPDTVVQQIAARQFIGQNGIPTARVTFLDKATGTTTIPVTSFNLDREEAAVAQRCTIEFPNVNPSNPKDLGYYTPYRDGIQFPNKSINGWYHEIIPGKNIKVEAGYGSNIVTIFTGTIDDALFDVNPGTAVVKLDCRDYGWKLVDKTVLCSDNGQLEYYLSYPIDEGISPVYLYPSQEDPWIEDIVIDLCMRAGFDYTDIIVQPTGIRFGLEFTEISYAEAIEQLCTLSGFELSVDEYGKVHFEYPGLATPNVKSRWMYLDGLEWAALGQSPIVKESIFVRGVDGTPFTMDEDYAVDLETGQIRRMQNSNIPDGGEILVDFSYPGWIFRQGQDIFQLPLLISRRNVYGKIRVRTEADDEAFYNMSSTMWDGSPIPSDKVLFVTDSCLKTEDNAQAVADRLGLDMERRYVTCNFAAVAVPWLQVGDIVQVIESSSTISEVYKIQSMSIQFDTSGFVMTLKTFHYGYSPVVQTWGGGTFGDGYFGAPPEGG